MLENAPLRSLKGVPSVDGEIRLLSCAMTSLEGLPAQINGGLALTGSQVSDLSDLPDIVGHLYLVNIPAKEMPFVNIGGEVFLSKHQTELIESAKSHGYRIHIVD